MKSRDENSMNCENKKCCECADSLFCTTVDDLIEEFRPYEIRNKNFLETSIEDESIDLVITDPPYKLNKTTGSMTSSSKTEKWQGMLKAGDKKANIDNEILFSEWLPKVYKMLKKDAHMYVFVNDKNVQDMLNEAEKSGFFLHNILVWHKNNKTPNRWYMKDCEFILFFRKGKSFPINNLGDSQLMEFKNINGKDKLHPTQKPVELIQKLILNSSKIGDTVLDPFLGSGSTGVACISTNRKFIGIELDDKYYHIAKERIENTYKQIENKWLIEE